MSAFLALPPGRAAPACFSQPEPCAFPSRVARASGGEGPESPSVVIKGGRGSRYETLDGLREFGDPGQVREPGKVGRIWGPPRRAPADVGVQYQPDQEFGIFTQLAMSR
jgi:hypothetical protein